MSSSALTQFARGSMPSPPSSDADSIEPQQVEAIVRTVTHDVDAALQMTRDVLAAETPAPGCGIVRAIVAQLDDDTLEALTESPAGCQLLELLHERGGDAAQGDLPLQAPDGSAVLPGGLGYALHALVRPIRRRSLRTRRA